MLHFCRGMLTFPFAERRKYYERFNHGFFKKGACRYALVDCDGNVKPAYYAVKEIFAAE